MKTASLTRAVVHLISAETGDDLSGAGGEEKKAYERRPNEVQCFLPQSWLQVVSSYSHLPPANLCVCVCVCVCVYLLCV